MKKLVLSAMICAAAVGTSIASTNVARFADRGTTEQTYDEQGVTAFKQAMVFHQHNVDMLFSQFEMAKKQLRKSQGSHAELDREKASFIKLYQNDIDQGLRVEGSKKTIAGIEATYVRKHKERDAYETAQLDKLQGQLRAALAKEQQQFGKAKRKYARFVNDETLPLLQKMEQYFAKAIDRASNADADHMTIAAL